LDSIIQAIDLARAGESTSSNLPPSALHDGTWPIPVDAQIRRVRLEEAHLERMRIVAHTASPESESFDMLRTHVLQEMEKNSWQFLAVTSPTAGCGKSTIACNLAMSVARLSDRAALLVDLDFRRPSVAEFFGVRCETGIADVLDGKASLTQAMVHASVGPTSLQILPGNGSTLHSSDLLASKSMANMFQTLKRESRNRIVILDMPSVLSGGDVISILPRIDATVLVAAVGKSTIEDFHECRQYLEQVPVVRVVVNRVSPAKAGGSRH
jgi:protein-tyrosine kinase